MSLPYAEVIGDPIAHSKSPLIHNFWLEKLGIDAEYRACHVKPDQLADYFARRREDAEWRGCNITIPHKIAAMEFADALDVDVSEVGATNCIYPDAGGLTAINTDVAGVVAAFDLFKPPFCLIGNGGAARAAYAALDPMRADCLRLLVRNKQRGKGLIDSMRPKEALVYGFDEIGAAIRDCNGLINATSLGMSGKVAMPDEILDALPSLAPDALVFDMVYYPLETDLLARARELGLRAVDGLTMLIGQADAAFTKFFGEPAPRQHDVALRALLIA